MIKKYLKKFIVLGIIAASVLAINPIGASAEWRKNDWGRWYAEGNSWAKGWKEIDGKWYYFQPTTGYMLRDQTIKGYRLGHDGAWIVGASADSIGYFGTDFEFDKVTGTIRSCKLKYGKNVKIVVPSVIDGVAVKNFGEGTTVHTNFGGAFDIELPNGLTSIGEKAFYNNYGMTSINIPYGVTSIGKLAFCNVGCASIVLPNSVTNIGERAFEGCKKLTSVTIPDSVTSIGKKAFANDYNTTFYVNSQRVKQLLIGSGVKSSKIIIK